MAAADGIGGERASLARAPPAVSKAKAKVRGRPKVAARPKIDLDEEIDKANQLAEMSRKMMNAAKSLQKNNRRCKQRLVRKAGKLSPEDLEIIAVLKRCGLYAEPVHDEDDEEEDEDGVAQGDHAVATSSVKKAKFSAPVPKIAGAVKIFNGFCEAMQLDQMSSSSSSSQGFAGKGITGTGMHPRGKRLGPQVSSPLSAESVVSPRPEADE
jgi:hypothetical protein